MDVLSESTPKANKEHRCMFCMGIINKGEIYNKQVIKNDYIYTWINHIKCGELAHKLKMYDDNWGDGIGSDEFMENVYQFLYDSLSEEEHDGLVGENAVNKAIEILENMK